MKIRIAIENIYFLSFQYTTGGTISIIKRYFILKNLYYDKHETDILFNQYQNLKNQKNKINFNSQGEGSGSGY